MYNAEGQVVHNFNNSVVKDIRDEVGDFDYNGNRPDDYNPKELEARKITPSVKFSKYEG